MTSEIRMKVPGGYLLAYVDDEFKQAGMVFERSYENGDTAETEFIHVDLTKLNPNGTSKTFAQLPSNPDQFRNCNALTIINNLEETTSTIHIDKLTKITDERKESE